MMVMDNKEMINNRILESDYDISLARCPKLQDRKEALLHYWRSVIKKHATVSAIVEEIIESQDSDLFLSLVLDCSSVPQVARAAQSDSTVLPILYKVTILETNKFLLRCQELSWCQYTIYV